MKIAFFNIRGDEDQFYQNALQGNEVECFTDSINPERLPLKRDYEVISVFTDSRVDASVIDALPDLKLIAARSTGFDHIDLAHAKQKNISVVNVPAYGEFTVAEFAFALLLAIAKKIVQADISVKVSEKFNREGLTGLDFYGKTFGVIGTGKIGVSAIKIAKGFGMEVLGFDAFPNEKLAQELGFTYMPMEELMSKSDFISLHVPFLPSTKHLIHQKNISFFKRGAILINTSRGEIIETAALITGLETGILGGAGLDVLENELSMRTDVASDPEAEKLNDKLIEMHNVIVTPHIASNTREAIERIRQTSVDNIKAFQNATPQNVVEPKS